MGESFKTQSIGPATPAVILAQAAEMEWQGLIVVGYLKPKEGERRVVAYNSGGLTDYTFQFLARKIEAMALKNAQDDIEGHQLDGPNGP